MLSYVYIHMISVETKQLLQTLEDFQGKIGKAFTETQLKKSIGNYREKNKITEKAANRLYTAARKLEVVWEDKPHANIYSYTPRNIIIEDLLSAWTSYVNQYVSHYGALYLNELVLQRPHDFHLSKETLPASGDIKNIINSLAMKQAFMKPARKSNQKGYYKGNTFFFHEKRKTEMSGIIEIELRGAKIKVSDIERTFIDSIMAPDLSGGLMTIIGAYKDVQLDSLKLIKYYRAINPIYPYWQRMGFILDILKKTENVNVIRKFFGIPQNDFYLDNNYKDEWSYNEQWKIHYPQGISI